jgi:hypothetical protein
VLIEKARKAGQEANARIAAKRAALLRTGGGGSILVIVVVAESLCRLLNLLSDI